MILWAYLRIFLKSIRLGRSNALQREREEKRRLREEKKRQKELEKKRQQEEHIRKVTSMELPLDWDNAFNMDSRTQGVHVESASDALIMSLTNLGRVDIEYMSSITGMDYKDVISALKGSIYQNPLSWDECFYKGWETSDEYLSGNLMRKYDVAVSANKKYAGYFEDNVNAIEEVLPPSVDTKNIYVTLGTPWIPADVIDDFVVYLLGSDYRKFADNRYLFWGSSMLNVYHDEVTGTWEFPNKFRYDHNVLVSYKYGTKRMEALHIIEKTLNMKTIAVWDEVSCDTNESGVKKVINRKETLAALEKQQLILEEFNKWIWKDPSRKERLEAIFENNYSCVRKRVFDGSFLTFPTMSDAVELYPYQKDAVARILFTPNTLLAHDVGSGKTYVMIAAGQELRRIGLSKKNMYVVPNNIVMQWRDIFLSMYPDADLLCIDPNSFTPDKRNRVLRLIRDNEYDGIIIAYSCFEQISISNEYYYELLMNQLDDINEEERAKNWMITSKLRKKKQKLEEMIRDKRRECWVSMHQDDESIYFDDLKINRLFLDEAHNYKNIPLETKVDCVLGINSKGSKKCQDMLDKVHLIQKQNEGKGIVFATGTPITNSITDAYTMQTYLQSAELKLLGLQCFDSWIGMFAERKTEFEIDVDTSSYRLATRFSKFHNLPELTTILSSIADFHCAGEIDGVPKHDGHLDAVVDKTPEFERFLEDISERADLVRNRGVNRRTDNMLKITTDGRKAALDIRLVDPSIPFSYQSKVAKCVELVAGIYFKTMDNKSTQLIFCDTSIPKVGFNIYDELKHHLIYEGIDEDSIAFIHDATTEKKREILFDKVRRGIIRILIGSTFKLGIGVNVQNKLIALHHIDVPWRPADMTQREGRILRQGNENDHVYIYRYITEGSFDAYSWQLLETKQRFISDLLSGSMVQRSGSDIENTVLDYAEVKALAIGNPLIKERVEASNELTRYLTLQKRQTESKQILKKELSELPQKIATQNELIVKCEEDVETYKSWKKSHPASTDPVLIKQENEERKQLREELQKALLEHVLQTKEKEFGEYKGFRIVLPANMVYKKPYIWIVGAGKYYLQMGISETGHLIRIDNLLEALPNQLEKLIETDKKLKTRQIQISEELKNNEDYSDLIQKYKERVELLDKKLGVNTNEI